MIDWFYFFHHANKTNIVFLLIVIGNDEDGDINDQ